MLANLTTPFLGVVATAAVGRLGEPYLLGGVAIASIVFDCMFWLFGFLRMGTVAFTAQAVGGDDQLEIRAVLARALLIAALVGILLIALHAPLSALIFSLMGGSDAVTGAARQYFAIRLWSAPFVLANYVLLGWLVGQARTGTALALQVIINVVNIALTAWLVLGLGTGIAGAAIAAVFAEGIGLLAGTAVAWRSLGGHLNVPRDVLLDRTKLLHMLAINRDIMIRTAALIAAFLFFTAQGACAGDTVLAANAVLRAGATVTPENVAALTISSVRDGNFLVLPHPEVLDMYRGKGADYDWWIARMRRLQRSLSGGAAAPSDG